MKIRFIFALVALLALGSAFTTRILDDENFNLVSEETDYYVVNPTPLVPGTGSGQFTCESPFTPVCVILSSVAPTQGLDGKWRVPKSNSTPVYGTLTFH